MTISSRITVVLSAAAAVWMGSVAGAAEIAWDGGGVGNAWSTAGNWVGDVGPGTNDTAVLGDDAPDAAQTIVLTASEQIVTVKMTATGNRSYTINDNGGGERLQVGSVEGKTVATQLLTVNVDLEFDSNFTPQRNDNPNNPIIFNGDSYNVGGRPLWGVFGWYDAGALVLNGAWQHTSQSYVGGGTLVIGNPYATSAVGENSTTTKNGPGVTLLRSDYNLGALASRATGEDWDFAFDGTTAGDTRTVNVVETFNGDTSAPLHDGKITFSPATNGSGTVILKTTRGWASIHNMPIDFGSVTDAIVEFSPPLSATPGTSISGAKSATSQINTITGAGSVRKSSNGTHIVRVAWTYTGGTVITDGRLRLEDDPYTSDVGTLPSTGTVMVYSNATYDVNGRSHTNGALAGGGVVNLGTNLTAATLTVARGVSPGTDSTVMALSVENEPGSGSLVLSSGGTSVFHVVTTGVGDAVQFLNDADLTLGGVLQVATNGFSNPFGIYTIFDLAGGTISGSFSDIDYNIPGAKATVSTASGDVVLSIRPPAGSVMTVQ